ncbi:MAG: fumarate hydratase [Atribacterota bacterium]
MFWTREKLYEEIYNLIVDCCLSISPDAKDLLQQSLKKETNETAKSMLQTILDDVEMAKKLNKPVCQSPGFGTVYVSFGKNANLEEIKDIKEIYAQAIIKATKNGYLRPSMVHPLTRKNPGDNSGIGVPNFEFNFIPEQEYVEHILSFKGCGAELGNAMKIMTTAMLGKNYVGFKKFVIETALAAGGKPCPPYAIGIGIGGQMDIACKLARQAVSIRDWRDSNPDPLMKELEIELCDKINSLKIGAAGTGGNTSCLAVKIETVSTHTAILPVAISFHCWVARRGGLRLYPDGKKEILFRGN